jgi:putative ABC transport system ATP-binding protein
VIARLSGCRPDRPRGARPAGVRRPAAAVAIARAIVTEPALLLADEPTGNLDTARSVELMHLLTRLNEEKGITIVMVTHEAEMAAFARRIVHFKDGRIEADEERRKAA